MAANPALAPAASRSRVPTGSDPKTYALLAHNLQDHPATLTMDLGGTGVATEAATGGGQVPVDLVAHRSLPAIEDTAYALDLPAYGFAILQVETR